MQQKPLISKGFQCLIMSGSGDHVDEAVEDDSAGGSTLHALEEGILLLGGGIGVLH